VKTFLIASFIAISTLACGSSPDLKVHSLEGGSLVDRVSNLSESIFALVAQSSTPAEAASKIDNYCQQNAQAIDAMKNEGQALEGADAEAFGNQLAKRMEVIQKRAEKALAGKEAVIADAAVMGAMFRCTPMPADAPEGDATDEAPSEE